MRCDCARLVYYDHAQRAGTPDGELAPARGRCETFGCSPPGICTRRWRYLTRHCCGRRGFDRADAAARGIRAGPADVRFAYRSGDLRGVFRHRHHRDHGPAPSCAAHQSSTVARVMADYRVVRHNSAQAFLERAQNWLVKREVEHNLILSIAAQLVQSPREDAYLVTIEKQDEIAGCAFRTPPHRLSVTDMPADAIEAFADHVE